MKNYFKEFISINSKLIDNSKKRESFIFVDRSRNLACIVSSLIAAPLSNKLKLNPILLTDKSNDNNIKVYKSFGFKLFFVGFRYKLIFLKLNILFKSIFLLIKSLFNIKINGFNWFILNYKVENVHIGDLIYDTYIKKNFYFIKPHINFYFINLLFVSIYRTYNIMKLINENIIKFVLINTESYCYNDGIVSRVAVKKGIKVYSVHGHAHSSFTYLDQFTNEKIKKGFLNLSVHGINSDFFINKIKINKNKMKRYLSVRLTGKLDTRMSGSRCLTRANKIKGKITKNELLNLLNIKNVNIDRIVLFAPHAFADAPHIFGTSFIFRDYYEQFEQTLNFIAKKSFKNTLWLIRPHPSSDIYNEQSIVSEQLKKYESVKNIKLCDSDLISTKNLIEICDNVVTGRGTIGLEFACNGKYPITAGSSTYSGLDISIECNSKLKYFKTLKEIHKIKKLNKKQTLVARRTLYYLDNMYPKYLNKKMSSLILSGQKSKIIDKEIFKINAKDQKKIFNKRLINNLKKYKFEEDKIYKHFFDNAEKL